MKKSYSLDEFKNYINETKKEKSKNDIIDIKNGTMTIHKSNLQKYLEKYMCKDEEDLDNTLYRSFGVWLSIVD